MERSTYSYRIVVNGEPEYSSAVEPDPRVEKLVEDAVLRLLRSETVDDVLDELHVRSRYLEDVPIYDLDGERTIGRVVVGSHDEVTSFMSDIVDRFADYLRQRVVDFSREWRLLSRTFPKPFVERLLREGNYAELFAPREEEVVVLYADIAGFTRLSEQVLREPAVIGRLIDRWSRHVVEIIWETGGVFDKMVGDCVIGLWGPPFYERSAAELCDAALVAARRIREFTAGLVQDPEFPELAESPFSIGVATGINYCPICVGLFGPNEAFTGFSSGMNNAARLQGLAAIDEILCMDSFVDACGDPSVFGEAREEKVKNVAEPLRYHLLEE
jgi:class 3 adenylate cyclase